MSEAPNFHIDAWTWQDAGSDEDPKSRLIATATFTTGPASCYLHVMALAVQKVGSAEIQTNVDPAFDEDWDGLCKIDDDAAFETVEINGRTYVIYAHPHCD